jgi:hypothetical protein
VCACVHVWISSVCIHRIVPVLLSRLSSPSWTVQYRPSPQLATYTHTVFGPSPLPSSAARTAALTLSIPLTLPPRLPSQRRRGIPWLVCTCISVIRIISVFSLFGVLVPVSASFLFPASFRRVLPVNLLSLSLVMSSFSNNNNCNNSDLINERVRASIDAIKSAPVESTYTTVR